MSKKSRPYTARGRRLRAQRIRRAIERYPSAQSMRRLRRAMERRLETPRGESFFSPNYGLTIKELVDLQRVNLDAT